MEILNLEGAEDTPKIILDKKNGIFEISGRSLPKTQRNFTAPSWNGLKAMRRRPTRRPNLSSKLNILTRPRPS